MGACAVPGRVQRAERMRKDVRTRLRVAPLTAAWTAQRATPTKQAGLLRPGPLRPCPLALELLPCEPVSAAFAMTLDQAKKRIIECARQMDAQYKRNVFDEWAIISLAENKGRLLSYIGPRKAGFQKNFLADAGALRAGLLAGQTNIGDFEFARHGVGTGFESFMVLGQGLFLICNNTVQSMDAITQDPLWLAAQVPFVELSDSFRDDALVMEA